MTISTGKEAIIINPTHADELTEEFAAASDPTALIRIVVLRAVVETTSDRGIISWIDGEDMVVADCYDPFGELIAPGTRWALEGFEVNRLARATGRPVSGPLGIPLNNLAGGLRDTYAQLRHLLVVPVTVGGEHIAMLAVSRRVEEEYSPRDVDTLAAIALHAAQPLYAARMRQERDAARAQLAEVAIEAESAERVKTDVLRLTSHELRTPLTVLHGYLSLIRDGFFGAIPEPMEHVVSILNRRTADINALVNDMLVAARVESGPATTTAELVDLRELVRSAFRTVQLLAGTKHDLALVLPDQPVTVAVDTERMAMAVRNIFDNAVKYSPDGGEVRCELFVDGTDAVVRVSDHGLGIAAEDRDKLFSRFGRILTTSNSHIPGIGLGLYFSREVARRHGGDVVLAGDEDATTVFDMRLPLAVN